MSEPSNDELRGREGLPTHIPVSEETSSGSPVFGAILSIISIVLLSFILRLAVPVEDSAVEMAVLLIAIGFAQVWLIFILLKSIRK
ncbi:MAG: hypothetical protein ACO1TE_20185 [Prosthecobacter sp.]